MGIFSSIGGIVNDVMGVTSAGKQNQAYALQSGAINHAYQKEFAQNGLQWTVEDAKKAGINPLYAVGGGATGASGGGVASGSTSPTGASGMGLLEGIGNLYNSTRATSANTELQEQQAGLIKTQIIKQLMENNVYKKLGFKTAEAAYEKLIAEAGQARSETRQTDIENAGDDWTDWSGEGTAQKAGKFVGWLGDIAQSVAGRHILPSKGAERTIKIRGRSRR